LQIASASSWEPVPEKILAVDCMTEKYLQSNCFGAAKILLSLSLFQKNHKRSRDAR